MTERATRYIPLTVCCWSVWLGVLTFIIVGEASRASDTERPRAYCLEANGIQGTAWVSGEFRTIMILDAPKAGRYVVSEGECKIETVNEEEGQ